MASVYGDLCKILKFFEQQLNNSDFEEKLLIFQNRSLLIF